MKHTTRPYVSYFSPVLRQPSDKYRHPTLTPPRAVKRHTRTPVSDHYRSGGKVNNNELITDDEDMKRLKLQFGGNPYISRAMPMTPQQYAQITGTYPMAKGGKIKRKCKSKLGRQYGGYAYTDPNSINTDFDWGDVGMGAVSGAVAGTAAAPGWGTLIGAVLGAGTGAITAATSQGDAINQRSAVTKSNARSKAEYDSSRLSNFDQFGSPMATQYAEGGAVKSNMDTLPYPKRSGEDLAKFEKAFAKSRANRLKGEGDDTFEYDGSLYHNYTVEEYDKGDSSGNATTKQESSVVPSNQTVDTKTVKPRNNQSIQPAERRTTTLNRPKVNPSLVNPSAPSAPGVFEQGQPFGLGSTEPYARSVEAPMPVEMSTEDINPDNMNKIAFIEDAASRGVDIRSPEFLAQVEQAFPGGGMGNQMFRGSAGALNTALGALASPPGNPGAMVSPINAFNSGYDEPGPPIMTAMAGEALAPLAPVAGAAFNTIRRSPAGQAIGNRIAPIASKARQGISDLLTPSGGAQGRVAQVMDELPLGDFQKTADYGRISAKGPNAGEMINVSSSPVPKGQATELSTWGRQPVSPAAEIPPMTPYAAPEPYMPPSKFTGRSVKPKDPTFKELEPDLQGYFRRNLEKSGLKFSSWLSKVRKDSRQLRFIEDQLELGYAEGGKVKPVGAGMQVQGKAGTDTIPMNIDGQPVKLDNKEVVVRDQQGNAVVISDDLGEADKYRTALAQGGDPQQVAFEFAERAKRLNPNPDGGGRFGGGYIHPDLMQYGINRTKNINLPSSNLNTIGAYNNAGLQSGFNPTGANKGFNVDSPSLSSPSFINSTTKSSGVNPPPSSNSWFADNPGLTAQIGGTALELGNNIAGMARLSNTPFPEFKYGTYKNLDPNVNNPVYNRARADMLSKSAAGDRAILDNTASSNIALQRLQGNRNRTLDAVGGLSAKQAAERGNIANQDTARMNAYNLAKSRALGAYDTSRYGDQIGRIQTGMSLGQSTNQNINAIVENAQRGAYDRETLNTIGVSLGIQNAATMSTDELVKELTRLGNENLQTLT